MHGHANIKNYTHFHPAFDWERLHSQADDWGFSWYVCTPSHTECRCLVEKGGIGRDHEAWRAEMFSKGSMPLGVSKHRLDSVHSNIASLQSMGHTSTLFKCILECLTDYQRCRFYSTFLVKKHETCSKTVKIWGSHILVVRYSSFLVSYALFTAFRRNILLPFSWKFYHSSLRTTN
jgi:hypothetical protein